MKVFDGAQNRLAAHVDVIERRECRARPACEGGRRKAVPSTPRLLEGRRQGSLGPPLGVERGVPELVQPLAVARVETD